MADSAGPLAHIRVLDLGRIMAAPWSTQILADLGADVIKVERPGAGDDTRSWGPPFLLDEKGHPSRESGYYLSVNRGKRSIAVDISTPSGREVILRLAETSDIVIENFKVGALARYGLDAKSLRERHPHLIYCSITGFGQDGPHAADPAYDFAIQAMGGLMSVTGEADGNPGAGPQKVGVPIVDIMTGMYATVAVLAALAKRAESGSGDAIDLAMLDVAAAMLANQGMNYLVSGKDPVRRGNQHPNIQPQDVFACADGDFVLAVGNDGQFARLAEAIGQPALAQDERFATNAARVCHSEALTTILSRAFASFDKARICALLTEHGVPAAPINSVSEVLAEEQIAHRDMVREIEDALGRPVRQIVSPLRFETAPLRFNRPAPLLGEHTDEILAELGIAVPLEGGGE